MTRYQRNILIDKIGAQGQKKISQARVLVAGAGGLGSGVIVNLASLGIGKIGVIDCDCVEISNLNRQYIHNMKTLGENKALSAKLWIEDFNPDIKVEVYNERFDESNADKLLSSYDVIADCFDNFTSKFLLCKSAIKNEKILIHAGVEEFSGQVCAITSKSACLGCFMPHLHGNKDASPKKGIVSPVVSTVASVQSMEILKAVLGFEILENTLLSYNALDESFRKIHLSKNLNCPVCKGI